MATAHLTRGADSARVLGDAQAMLAARGLDHATIQVERPERSGGCATGC